MNEPINDGGPAFPAPEAAELHYGDKSAYMGMTLRDWFASQATEEDLQIRTAPANTEERVAFFRSQGFYWSREWAKYHYADKMLEARQLQRRK